MHLTLFVPDLFWPDHDNAAAFDMAGLPEQGTLARFLSLAEHTRAALATTDSWESQLASLLSHDIEPISLAALRFASEQVGDAAMTDMTARRLLCADPVNLDFIQQYLVLNDLTHAAPDRDETAALISHLNEEFAGEGRFFTTNRHWYFEPADPQAVLPDLAATSRVAGRRIDADESRQVLGTVGLQWINRIQMCLSNHPVNEARQMRGLPSINSLWPWGAHALTRHSANEPAHFDRVVGEHPLLRCLSQRCKISYDPTNQGQGSALVLDTALATAIMQDDLAAWQSAANTLIRTWIAPALEQLKRGNLETLTLISLNERTTDRWRLDKQHRGLHPGWWQRALGRQTRHPDLAALIQSW